MCDRQIAHQILGPNPTLIAVLTWSLAITETLNILQLQWNDVFNSDRQKGELKYP